MYHTIWIVDDKWPGFPIIPMLSIWPSSSLTQDRQWDSRLRPALSITSSKWIYFFYQYHCIRETWGEHWLGRRFLVAAESYFLPAVPINKRGWGGGRKGKQNNEDRKKGYNFISLLQFTSTCRTHSPQAKNPTLAPKSGTVWIREALRRSRTTKLAGDTEGGGGAGGGVSDPRCQPPDAIYSLPESFLPQRGNHTSSPFSSKSFVNFPDLFSPA